MNKLITEISTMDAIELGRIEGIKEVLGELEEICNTQDIKFISAYVKARRRSIEDIQKFKMKLGNNEKSGPTN